MSYTSQQFLLCDNSSVANYISWASKVSAAIAAMGWVQQNDTGQVVWVATVLTLTQVATNGTAVYSYSSYTGPAPRIGMSVVVSGFATGGNNGTFVLTAVSGGASGTVTVAKTTQSNETHAGSGTTTVTTATSGTPYEVWCPGDAGTVFYLKVGYQAQTNQVAIQMTLGMGTNGAGTLTGFTVGPAVCDNLSNQGTTAYECDFSGDTNRLGFVLFRNNSTSFLSYAVERTHNVDGSDSTDGVTLLVNPGAYGSFSNCWQQTLVFAVGAGIRNAAGTFCGLADGNSTSSSFNNNIPISPVFPCYGKFGNPMTCFAFVRTVDVSAGCFFSTTLYGATRTYLVIGSMKGGMTSSYGCMRYD